MKVYLADDVLTAARTRISRLFDEFPQVVVNMSGGKDSTVVLHLTLEEAERRGRLPLDVMFLDQEAEWEVVIQFIRDTLSDPRIKPWWFQMPMRISNAASGAQPWLWCWREGDRWIREKEPDSIHNNIYGTDRFKELFTAILARHWPNTPVAQIFGVRAEESPARLAGLTSYACYRDITWGNADGKRWNHYTFYPIYDWHFADVWKYIHESGHPYCPLYDWMYQYGIAVRNMRVSSVHHETAVRTLTFLQEIEPVTWDRITARITGANTVSHLGSSYQVPRELPFMFASWKEYRDYLLATLITDPNVRRIFRKQFDMWDAWFIDEFQDQVTKLEISCLLVNDYHGTKIDTFVAAHAKERKNNGKRRDRFSAPDLPVLVAGGHTPG